MKLIFLTQVAASTPTRACACLRACVLEDVVEKVTSIQRQTEKRSARLITTRVLVLPRARARARTHALCLFPGKRAGCRESWEAQVDPEQDQSHGEMQLEHGEMNKSGVAEAETWESGRGQHG